MVRSGLWETCYPPEPLAKMSQERACGERAPLFCPFLNIIWVT